MDCEASADVLAAIPHRPPFLFVDRVVERSENAIVTEWRVPPDLECFAGHYPGDPILPGVLVSEFAIQSGAILVSSEAASGVPVLVKIEDARFRKIVRPGETLAARVELVDRVGPARYLKAAVTSSGESVAKLSFTVALADVPR